MKHLFCVLLLVFFCLSSDARGGSYPVETLTPGGPLTSLAVDDTHVWVGSFTGLYRFDKQQGTWDFFDETDGLSGNNISALTVTDDGTLWAAASRAGLNRYDGASWSHTDIGEINIGALSYYGGTLFAARWDHGYYPGNFVGNVFAVTETGTVEYDTRRSDFIVASLHELVPISGDSFYLLENLHMSRYDIESTVTPFAMADLPYPAGAWDIASAADTLWAVAPDGVCFLDGETWMPVSIPDLFPTEDVWSIATGPDDRLWLLSRQGCVVVRQNGEWDTLSPGLDDIVLLETNSFHFWGGQAYGSTFMNRSWALDGGDIWACSGGSLFRFDGTDWEEFPVGGFMQDTNFSAAAVQADNTIWAANATGILRMLDDGGFTQYEKGNEIPDSTITDLLVDDADQVWATFGDGLRLKFADSLWQQTDDEPIDTTVPAFRDTTIDGWIYNLILPDETLYNPEMFNQNNNYGGGAIPRSKFIKKNGIVWLAGSSNERHHMSVFDIRFYTYYNGTEHLSDLIVDQQGPLLWVTENDEFWVYNIHGLEESSDPGNTDDGVIAYNFAGDVVESYTLSDGFPVPYVTDITEAPDGAMIVATPSGLFRIRRPLNTAVEEHASHEETGPAAFIAPYPNPFNARVTIPFTTAEFGSVECAIYSITGQRIRTLVNSRLQPGYHQVVWDGTDETGSTVATGLYIVRLLAGNHATTVRIVLLK